MKTSCFSARISRRHWCIRRHPFHSGQLFVQTPFQDLYSPFITFSPLKGTEALYETWHRFIQSLTHTGVLLPIWPRHPSLHLSCLPILPRCHHHNTPIIAEELQRPSVLTLSPLSLDLPSHLYSLARVTFKLWESRIEGLFFLDVVVRGEGVM